MFDVAKKAKIFLDKPNNTYNVGETVSGRIEYEFESPTKIRGVRVQFDGEARTKWQESKYSKNTQTYIHRDVLGQEEFFSIQNYLLGSSSGTEQIEIPAGPQVYKFECVLPPVLPSSFKDQYGYIHYTVTVTLDRPWRFNQDTEMEFTVATALDLNLNPSYKEPIHMQIEKTFCCLWCGSPPLAVDIRAPVSGYCPGQTIPVSVEIDNKSEIELCSIEISLRKVMIYKAMSKTKEETEIVSTVTEGSAPAKGVQHWTINLLIPPTVPSTMLNCNIIKLNYKLKVVCVLTGPRRYLTGPTAETIVTIGDTPFADKEPAPLSPGQPA